MDSDGHDRRVAGGERKTGERWRERNREIERKIERERVERESVCVERERECVCV